MKRSPAATAPPAPRSGTGLPVRIDHDLEAAPGLLRHLRLPARPRRETVTFFWGGDDDLDALAGLDPDRDWRRLCLGEQAWTLQTFLRLRDAGLPVELSRRVPESGLVLFHANHARQLGRRRWWPGRIDLVAVRGDKTRWLPGDHQVTQNGLCRRRGTFFVPSWPQPGLIPRDPARGSRIERVVFKGFGQNLHPDLRSPRWEEFLRVRGLEWVTDCVPYRGAGTDVPDLAWPDFRTADLVVAVRPDDLGRHPHKPATKLYNSWLAGVPALLGPEPAYRELRRSLLDYVEVRSLEEAMVAVDTLLAHPGLYRAMVEHGRERARAFTVPRITERWERLLFDELQRPGARSEPRSPRLRLQLG